VAKVYIQKLQSVQNMAARMGPGRELLCRAPLN